MSRDVGSEKQTYPRMPQMRARRSLTFGLPLLFAFVTIAGVLAGAAKMPAALGVLFALDAAVVGLGLYYLRAGFAFRRAGSGRRFEMACASAHVAFGLALIAYAALTFGGAALVSR